MSKYILGIDQSTSGTKALLFDENGKLSGRNDLPHKQIINEVGWVEHDPEEIFSNILAVVAALVEKTGIDKSEISGVGLSNQRETVVLWDNKTGRPVYNAVVWQCARAEPICEKLRDKAQLIQDITGLNLSPYFSAAKAAWVLENVDGTRGLAEKGDLNCGTMDSWVIWKLTNGGSFKTDYSNASRTQLFNIKTLNWDQEVCNLFGVPIGSLPQVCNSNSLFGMTDFGGYLEKEIPIHSVLGDSHGALYGQGCHDVGTIKATYGTGSSVMLNIGPYPVFSTKGIVTSLAWGIDGQITYVLEGNINYTGAVMKWLEQDLGLISSAQEGSVFSEQANPMDTTYLVPAFTGLGAPYWDSKAKAVICGMTRNTGKAEVVKAAEDSIAYQITDIIELMKMESDIEILELCADGGPTGDRYLMQFQSSILNIPIRVSKTEELSGTGAAYMAGIALKMYSQNIFGEIKKAAFYPDMSDETREKLYSGWKKAVQLVLSNK